MEWNQQKQTINRILQCTMPFRHGIPIKQNNQLNKFLHQRSKKGQITTAKLMSIMPSTTDRKVCVIEKIKFLAFLLRGSNF